MTRPYSRKALLIQLVSGAWFCASSALAGPAPDSTASLQSAASQRSVQGLTPSLEGGVESIPDIALVGELDDRLESCNRWTARLLVFRDVDGIEGTLARNFGPWVMLNLELVEADRLEESADLCERFHGTLPDSQLRKLRVVFLWARTEILRDRLVEAAERLDEHERLQATLLPQKEGDGVFVRERGYCLTTRADIAFARGLMDRAYEYKVAAEREWELASTKLPVRHLRDLRAEIDGIGINIFLGQGELERALSLSRERASALATEMQELVQPTSDDSRHGKHWAREFKRREALALYLLALRGQVDPEEAIAILQQLLDQSEAKDPAQFEALTSIWELYLLTGDLQEATVVGERARLLASSPERVGRVSSLQLSQAILAGVSKEEEEEAFARWRVGFDGMLARSLEDAPRAAGSGFLAFGRRRYVLWAGLNRLRLRGDLEGAFRLYLETERLGSQSRLLRESEGERDVLDLSEVRSTLLTEGEVILIPIILPRGSLLFLISEDDLQCLPIEEDGDAYALARDLERLVATPPSTRQSAEKRRAVIRQKGDALRKLLLPEAALDACLRASIVTIVDDHLQGRLPIDLIEVDGSLLSARVPMAEMTSLDVRASIARRPDRKREAVLSVVTNVPSPERLSGAVETGLEPLSFQEAAVIRLLPECDEEVRLITGAAATEEKVLSSVLPSASMVTFIAHGVVDFSLERPATLWLGTDGGGDGLLTADEIETLQGGPEVVFLATCGSGRGALRTGDAGAGHLGGALMMAGAKAVILSSGDLPVEATVFASELIHDLLMEGESVARALQLARAQMAQDPRYGDPYNYAQLRVFGLGHYVPFPRDPLAPGGATLRGTEGRVGPSIWALTALVVALLLAWGTRRRPTS